MQTAIIQSYTSDHADKRTSVKTIKIQKEEYEYSFHGMRFKLNKRIKTIQHLYYWTSYNPMTHHLYLKGEMQHLSVTLRFTNEFLMPDETTLNHGKRWYISLPEEYDISNFIYDFIFRQKDTHSSHPVKTFIGISPRQEKRRRNKKRREIKKLIQSFEHEIKSGMLDHLSAATHFSCCTGMKLNASERYFRRFAPHFRA
ncbi:hypothetical protein [Klebsiella sp. PL-2018]|uniref:hypothetical protein n=1 Tax=Klebsiella TaxID=570 RepID=UPI001C248C9C|nr:hypothetical protein [Klebsiella sp. PL-2018]QXD01009.1 hypothetical protein MKleb_5508 [Klebsiella sp. PL-2018]